MIKDGYKLRIEPNNNSNIKRDAYKWWFARSLLSRGVTFIWDIKLILTTQSAFLSDSNLLLFAKY